MDNFSEKRVRVHAVRDRFERRCCRKLRSLKIDFHEKPNVEIESGAPSSPDYFADTALFQEPNKPAQS
jgi:hypothetical protein